MADEIKPKSLAGTWLTPFPLLVEEDGAELGRFTASAGSLRLTIEADRSVTLRSGEGEAVAGKADFAVSRIQWQGGAAWIREATDTRSFTFGGEGDLLFSEEQVEVIIDRINESVDIPLLGESFERKLIAPPVRKANQLLKGALRSFVAQEWVRVIEVLLEQTKTREVGAKGGEIAALLQVALQAPLVAALNERIDLPLLTEGMEKHIFEKLVHKLTEEIVEWVLKGMTRCHFV